MNIVQIKGANEIILPEGCGVYILTDSNGDIVYVGKSKNNIIGRMAAHKYAMQFSRAFFIKCKGYKEMDELESKLILKCKPFNNKTIDRKHVGLMNKKDIKKIIQVDVRIINNAAKKYDIKTVMIGSQRLYEKGIIQATQDYIESLKSKPLSYNRNIRSSL